MTILKEWMIKYFEPESSLQLFSFKYGNRSSVSLLETWKVERISKELDEHRTQHELIYNDPKTYLKVYCILTEYKDYPAVEWVLFFENTGDNESLILEDVQGNRVLTGPAVEEFPLLKVETELHLTFQY